MTQSDTTKTNSMFPLLLIPVVLILAASNWIITPDNNAKFVFAGGLYTVVALMAYLLPKIAAPDNIYVRRSVNNSIGAGGVIMAGSLGMKLLENMELVSANVTDIVSGMMVGLFFIVIGNNIPKKIIPLSEHECNPAKQQSLHRFMGWSFVLMGIAYIACFFFVEPDRAHDIGMYFIWGGVGINMVRAAMVWMGRNRTA